MNFGTNVWGMRIDELDASHLDDENETGCPELKRPMLLDDCEYSEDAKEGAKTSCKMCRSSGQKPRAKTLA